MKKYFNIKKLLRKQEIDIIPLFDINRQKMEFYYNKFIELEKILQHMDSFLNSVEYEQIYKLAFSYLNQYIELYRKGYSDFKYKRGKE